MQQKKLYWDGGGGYLRAFPVMPSLHQTINDLSFLMIDDFTRAFLEIPWTRCPNYFNLSNLNVYRVSDFICVD